MTDPAPSGSIEAKESNIRSWIHWKMQELQLDDDARHMWSDFKDVMDELERVKTDLRQAGEIIEELKGELANVKETYAAYQQGCKNKHVEDEIEIRKLQAECERLRVIEQEYYRNRDVWASNELRLEASNQKLREALEPLSGTREFIEAHLDKICSDAKVTLKESEGMQE